VSKYHYILGTLLAAAAVLSGGARAHAQNGYFYGTYYPDRNLFLTYDETRNFVYMTPERFAALTHNSAYLPSTRSVFPPASTPVVSRGPTEAWVHIVLADSNAKVWFDGAATKAGGADRVFETPALQRGSTYHYHIKATWTVNGRQMTRERDIDVIPGETTTIDFSHEGAEKLSAAPR
jgi:uncharacterized protein (TIGR03000 family)